MKESASPIGASYWQSLFLKCAIIFGASIIITAVLLYLLLHKPSGVTYGETFATLSTLRHDLLLISISIYSLSLLVTSAGIILITLLYSHRVVGPIYRLSVIARQAATGDLIQKARLRKKDVVLPLADELNSFLATYNSLIEKIKKNTGDQQGNYESALSESSADGKKKFLTAMTEKAQELGNLLDTIH